MKRLLLVLFLLAGCTPTINAECKINQCVFTNTSGNDGEGCVRVMLTNRENGKSATSARTCATVSARSAGMSKVEWVGLQPEELCTGPQTCHLDLVQPEVTAATDIKPYIGLVAGVAFILIIVSELKKKKKPPTTPAPPA